MSDELFTSGSHMTKPTANRREFTRVRLAVGVEVDQPDQPKISGRGRDLSLKGVYVVCPRQLPPGTPCHVTIVLGEAEPLLVHASGRVVYAEPEGMGIEFVEVDVDSFIHLQNLVLYNSRDTAQVEREFRRHIGLKRKD